MAQTARSEAERSADAARDAAGQGAELGARAGDAAADAARGAAQEAQRAAEAALEIERILARRTAEGTAEFGQAFAAALDEQTRHNVEAFKALTRAVDWDRVVQVQTELLRVSMERFALLNQRYLEVAQAVIASAASAAKDRSRPAA